MTQFENETKALRNEEAEQAVIGACIVNPGMFPIVNAILTTRDFYNHANRYVWDALRRLEAEHLAIDLNTVAWALGDKLAEIGGRARLTELVNAPDSSMNAESYAREVKTVSVCRAMVLAAGNIAREAYRDGVSMEEMVSLAQLEVRNASRGLDRRTCRSAGELAAEFYAEIQARQREGRLPGVATGFRDLDWKLGGGLRKGSLNIVAAFPGGGKTALLTTIARHVGRTGRVLFFSLEMTAHELTARVLSQATGINFQRLETGSLNPSEWQGLAGATGEAGDLHLTFDDGGRLPVPELRACVLRAMAEGEVDLVVIDYAGLMQSPGEGEYEQYRALSRDLKLLAKELDVPILVAHQLNRKGREADAPKIHHLRGSGTWEQDADVVLILYPTGAPAVGGFIPHRLEIAKQRNGPTGCVDLFFKPETTEFVGRQER